MRYVAVLYGISNHSNQNFLKENTSSSLIIEPGTKNIQWLGSHALEIENFVKFLFIVPYIYIYIVYVYIEIYKLNALLVYAFSIRR